ncbi:MAG TPA: ATP-grasp domain-containing protein [Pseudonocardiaceae bacterium]|nr:ATP-grasp domain-containing protein [Pseudonocardiaceae bacterium]
MAQRDAVIFVNTRRTTLEAQACFFAANRIGLDVVLLADKPIPLPPGVAAEVVLADTYDGPAALVAAREVARRRPVAGVVTWGDRDVETVAYLAEGLGLPGNSPAAAAAARNKHTARTLLEKAAPHAIPRFYHVRSPADLAPAAEHVGFPAILKPTGASSSKGIFEVDDAGQLSVAFDRLMHFTRAGVDPIFQYYPQDLILEERLDGTEHSIEGIVVDGRVVSAGVTDKWTAAPFYLEYLQIHPSALPPAALDRACVIADEVVGALGLDCGAIHLEFRHLPDGAVKILEMNARTGGNFITSHLIPLSREYDFLGETLRVTTGAADPRPMPDPTGVVAGSIQVITKETGRFAGFADLGAALTVPGIEHFTYEIPPGTEVRQPPDEFITPILATFIGRALDQPNLIRLLEEAADACWPLVETG